MEREKKCYQYNLLQVLLWGSYGVSFSYISRYLLNIGLNNIQVGLALVVSTAVSFIVQPIVAGFTDGIRLTTKKVILVGTVIMIISTGALLAPIGVAATVVFYSMCYVLLPILSAFVNAIGVQTAQSGYSINFGIARGSGSVTYALTVKLTNVLIDRFGYISVPVFTLVLLMAFIVVAGRYPVVVESVQPRLSRHTDGMSAVFRRNPSFALFLIAVIFLNISHACLRANMYQISVWKGNPSAQGTAMSIGSFLEVMPMFMFERMRKKKSSGFWMRVCAPFFLIRNLLVLVLPGVGGLYIAQATQMLSSGLYFVASVYYVADTIDVRDTVRGQVYLGAAGTIGSLIAYAASGIIIEMAGVGALLTAGCVMAGIGLALMLISSSVSSTSSVRFS